MKLYFGATKARVASHTDVLRLLTRSSPRTSWGGTRDKPKNFCVGGYGKSRKTLEKYTYKICDQLLKEKRLKC